MYSGQAIIDYLATEVDKTDSETSSHWKKYHSSFRFTGNGFDGLLGFGGCSKPRGKFLSAVEQFLQSRFRKMGGTKFSVIDELAKKITKKQNRTYDLDVLRQVLTISFLQDRAPGLLSENAIGCVIGDGFGSMTSLLLASQSASSVILVNLTKTLMVDLWYLRQWMGDELFATSVNLVTNVNELSGALNKLRPEKNVCGNIIAIQAQYHELIKYCDIDFVINIASMGEMNPENIAEYFKDIRGSLANKNVTFYCCNREEKNLPDGTVTRFTDYPWSLGDKIIVDELCPWTQQYYSFLPPFYRNYDGPFRHRLAVLQRHV